MDTALWYAGIVTEAAVIGLLVYRRIFRTLPIFSAYLVWAICSDVAMILISRKLGSDNKDYLRILVIEIAIDSLIQLSVLVELAWAILRPIRTALPRGALVAVAALVVIAAAVIWPFAGISVMKNLSTQWHLLMRLKQTVSILRVVFFLVIAACSQVLALGWRNRELQVATGLGFLSLAGLGAAMLQVHQANAILYHYADQFVAACYFCSLLYWAVSFAQIEAPRHEFSPKMQNFVLSLAGVARANRIALSDHPNQRDRD